MNLNFNEISLLEKLSIELEKRISDETKLLVNDEDFGEFLESSRDTLFYLKEKQLSRRLSNLIHIITSKNQSHGDPNIQGVHNIPLVLSQYISIDPLCRQLQIKNEIKKTINQLERNIINKKTIFEKDKQSWFISIDRAIETTLKEYETLRNEILQNMQNRSQLILLGLAAIFTIAGLGLTPLTGLLTSETITVPSATINSPSETITIQKFVIERGTTNNTIRLAMIPVAVVLAWIIPIINIYIIYRCINWTQQVVRISSYIANRIENKLFKLSWLQYDLKYRSLVSQEEYNKNIIGLSWEQYMSKRQISIDGISVIIICFLFFAISLISVFGANILLELNYQEFIEDKNFSDEEFFRQISYFKPHRLIFNLINLRCLIIFIFISLTVKIVDCFLENNKPRQTLLFFYILLILYLISYPIIVWIYFYNFCKIKEFDILDLFFIVIPYCLVLLTFCLGLFELLILFQMRDRVKEDLEKNIWCKDLDYKIDAIARELKGLSRIKAKFSRDRDSNGNRDFLYINDFDTIAIDILTLTKVIKVVSIDRLKGEIPDGIISQIECYHEAFENHTKCLYVLGNNNGLIDIDNEEEKNNILNIKNKINTSISNNRNNNNNIEIIVMCKDKHYNIRER